MEPFVDLCVRNNIIAKVSTVNIQRSTMLEAKYEVIDILEREALKLQYLAEAEGKAGLSEILMDISTNISCIRYAECLKTDDGGDQNGKTD